MILISFSFVFFCVLGSFQRKKKKFLHKQKNKGMYFMLWILCNFASFKGKQKVIKKEKKKEKKIRKKGKEQYHI
jgi:hypothetical protein